MEPDERRRPALPSRLPRRLGDVDFACRQLVAESGDELSEEIETVASLVRDQRTRTCSPPSLASARSWQRETEAQALDRRGARRSSAA